MSGVVDPALRVNTQVYKRASEQNELPQDTATLLAAARHLGEACHEASLAFYRCKQTNDGNPAKCLEEGSAVTNCAHGFFAKMSEVCGAELEAQAACLRSKNQVFDKCRKTQAALDECVFDKLGLAGAFKTYNTPASGSPYDS
eukprot:m.6026 g.6026  ORF g.6026 m.6026 type:complete len:143 (-) comp5119_c0_seq1:105-533(-)